ncbi:L-threonine O-3-phosphate decarboxylase [Tumebacillus sp. BK434]|uniref:threonine-phosphate decarboxylase CobD n=1 Tax=Tumebacillus sp. BK434 TaxID=2512169 RepID=UPI001050AC5D|nr:threonine-phosphate decarboxylase CobD [Tumebacillus sp. BK434]TCP55788.1 L-threonine O-3-phosphate decarboxylase [Tumebacillus sp. BK434]
MAKHGGNLQAAAEQYGVPPESFLDFSANINPLGPPQLVKQAILRGVESVMHYPDPEASGLHLALAEKTGLPGACILAGNGAAELLFAIFHALRPKRVGLLQPCFAEYAEAAQEAELVSVYARAEDDFLPVKAELLAVCGEVDVFVIASPNNPNGRTVPQEWLEELADVLAARGAFLVVDEAFVDFLPERRVTLRPNVILLRSLTKFYAIPGLRLGYLLGEQKLVARIKRELPPWSVNVLAQLAGVAGLQDAVFTERTLAWLTEERPFLVAGLQQLGAKVYSGEVNFVLFALPQPDLAERLGRRGILIRSCADYPGLGDGFYRVAVRTREENLQLLQAVKEEIACPTCS